MTIFGELKIGQRFAFCAGNFFRLAEKRSRSSARELYAGKMTGQLRYFNSQRPERFSASMWCYPLAPEDQP